MNRSELAIVIILRVLGLGGLCAIFAVFMPFAWMDAIHRWVGLGELPDEPIVSYLARSLSAFYAGTGAILVFISRDIRRYRAMVTLMATLIAVIGVLITGIDIVAGMPATWTWGEGPPTIILGLVILWLLGRVDLGEPDG